LPLGEHPTRRLSEKPVAGQSANFLSREILHEKDDKAYQENQA
jgi:hypothetical protein